MKKNTQIYLKQFIRDIIPVVFGILIALFINNWNENRKDKIYINKFHSALKKELAETNEDIIDKMPYQKSLIDTLDFYSTDSKVSIADVMNKVNGIQVPKVRINSWRALSNTKIELLEYEQLSILADIEDGKESLDFKVKELAGLLYSSTIHETGKETKQMIKFMMFDIINTEEWIQGNIEEILKE